LGEVLFVAAGFIPACIALNSPQAGQVSNKSLNSMLVQQDMCRQPKQLLTTWFYAVFNVFMFFLFFPGTTGGKFLSTCRR